MVCAIRASRSFFQLMTHLCHKEVRPGTSVIKSKVRGFEGACEFKVKRGKSATSSAPRQAKGRCEATGARADWCSAQRAGRRLALVSGQQGRQRGFRREPEPV